jgi:hypothetical protein
LNVIAMELPKATEVSPDSVSTEMIGDIRETAYKIDELRPLSPALIESVFVELRVLFLARTFGPTWIRTGTRSSLACACWSVNRLTEACQYGSIRPMITHYAQRDLRG